MQKDYTSTCRCGKDQEWLDKYYFEIWFSHVKFVLKLLTMEKKQLCLEVTQDMLNISMSYSDFMNTVIIGNESWAYGYDLDTKWSCHSGNIYPLRDLK